MKYGDDFNPHGFLAISNILSIFIEISNDGSDARYCECMYTTIKQRPKCGRWQEIKYTKSFI